jgi:hypothetical protein
MEADAALKNRGNALNIFQMFTTILYKNINLPIYIVNV